MKVSLFFLLFWSLSYLGYAQAPGSDLIIKVSGDSLNAKILTVGQNEITYRHPNESVTYALSKNVIKEIKFSSGRIEKVNNPIIINGEEDWEKVNVTTLESDVYGLKEAGRVLGMAGGQVGRGPGKREAMALEEIKRKAAIRGGHLLLIESRNIDPGNRLLINAVVYKY